MFVLDLPMKHHSATAFIYLRPLLHGLLSVITDSRTWKNGLKYIYYVGLQLSRRVP